MSDIKPGDLVMVVRWLHGCQPQRAGAGVGFPFVVQSTAGYCLCMQCWKNFAEPSCIGPYGGYPASWLKKIDPLPELEDVQREEAIEA